MNLIKQKAPSLLELRQNYEDKPTSQSVYEIDGVQYVVVSHYTGNKDINKVIGSIAEKQAYDALHLERDR